MGEMEGGGAGEVVNGGAANTSPWQKSGINVAQGGPPIAAIGGGGGGGRTSGRRCDPPPQSVIATPRIGGRGEGVGAEGVEWAPGVRGGVGGGKWKSTRSLQTVKDMVPVYTSITAPVVARNVRPKMSGAGKS